MATFPLGKHHANVLICVSEKTVGDILERERERERKKERYLVVEDEG